MTVEEFKKKYPEKSHLEGDALWNAMEDCMSKTSVDFNAPIKDWMGNEVKEGDIVSRCTTRSIFGRECALVNFKTGEKISFINPNKFLWEMGEGYLVKKYDEYLGIEQNIVIFPLYDFATFKSPSTLLCIKGVSDNREKYIEAMGGIYSEEEV